MERLSELTDRMRREQAQTDFLKYVWARAKHQDHYAMRSELARFRSPRIDGILSKAAVPGATGQDAGWASEWQDFHSLTREWAIRTSGLTFIGRLPTMRVPFQTRTLSAAAPDAEFVGAGKGVPMSALNLESTLTMQRTKVATVAAMTNELVAAWRPGTGANIDAVLTRAVVRGLDKAFLGEQAAVDGETPAGVLNGVSPLGALGSDVATVTGQIESMLNVLTDGGSDLQNAMFAMHPRDAAALATLRTSEGVRAFPNLTVRGGGDILGIPVAVTVGATRAGSPTERIVALVDGGLVALADDGEMSIQTSRVADVHMADVTTQDSGASSTNTSVVSLWQVDATAVKCLRFMNWQRLSDSAAAFLTVAA